MTMTTDSGELAQRLDRLEAAVDRLVGVVEGLADPVAMGVDIADAWVEDRVGHAQMEARLASLERAVLAMTAPEVTDSLTRLAGMMPRLERVAGLAADFDDHVAVATDVADEYVREHLGGAAVDERLMLGLDALERLSEPGVFAALVRLGERAPSLERAAGLAGDLDNHVGMAVDVIDEWVHERLGGVDVGQRVSGGAEALIAITEPGVLQGLVTLAGLAPRFAATASAVVELDQIMVTVSDALRAPSEPRGAFGLFRALSDPDVQRGVGQMVEVARRLGAQQTQLPTTR